MRISGGICPACTACAAFTMSESCACRNTSRRSTTGTTPESMAADRNDPALTGGSWSASPAAAATCSDPSLSPSPLSHEMLDMHAFKGFNLMRGHGAD